MRLGDLAARAGCRLEGDEGIDIRAAAALDEAVPGTITFLADPRLAARSAATQASAIVLGHGQPAPPCAVLRAEHPYEAFTRVVELLHPAARPAPGIHPTAVVAADARLGSGAFVGALSVIGGGTVVGRDAVLHPRVTIGSNVTIGDRFTAHPGVVVADGVSIGHGVTLHPGAVVGSDGFGYLPLPDGIRKIPQVGTVVLEDDVEVGANATIDRAALGETRIGRGTKIDNLVQIAHGCRIGPGCLLAAQVGLAGGTVLGPGVMMGGQAGAAGHLSIGAGAQIAAKTGLHQDVPAGGVFGGYPAGEVGPLRRSAGGPGRVGRALPHGRGGADRSKDGAPPGRAGGRRLRRLSRGRGAPLAPLDERACSAPRPAPAASAGGALARDRLGRGDVVRDGP